MRKYQKGFTLIELLVVIAIIGILSSVVLASLNSARQKGSDAAAKSGMDGFRAQAILFYDDNRQSYGSGDCDDAGTVFASSTSMLNNISSNATPNSMTCVASTSVYALSVTLKGGGNWCIDSNGAATSSTINTTTGLCNY